ncbi:MAG: efflux RND transporter periplasmic adaptor subunit [Deltaproteobacteria bacterium]|nr:efflux RND transporter periplasmic adaptor subunit [Deltaproteobacteria bacterium]
MKFAMKFIGIALAMAMLAGVMAYLAGFFETKIPIDYRGVVPSQAESRWIAVEITTEPLIEKAAGTVRAKVETVISPVITATITSIFVYAGDEVKRGDVLVQLDARELRARVDQARQAVAAAKARLKQAEKDYGRLLRIYKADVGAVSKARLDQVETALSEARADLLRLQRQVDEARTALSYSKLTAPFSGRIVERYADPGDTARQGQPLLKMYDPATIRIEASVRESIASKLTKGKTMITEIDALNRRLSGVVEEIVPYADPGSRTFLVRVSLENATGLYPGMFGRLLIPVGQTKKIYIPADAVTHLGQLDFVVVKTGQGPARRYVRLGTRSRDGRVEVISGLRAGEEILIR